MKLQFDAHQDYQLEAINTVVALADGHPFYLRLMKKAHETFRRA